MSNLRCFLQLFIIKNSRFYLNLYIFLHFIITKCQFVLYFFFFRAEYHIFVLYFIDQNLSFIINYFVFFCLKTSIRPKPPPPPQHTLIQLQPVLKCAQMYAGHSSTIGCVHEHNGVNEIKKYSR